MKKAILFVHGLNGGSATWGNFKKLIEDDPDLSYTPFFYEYPSALVRIIPFAQEKYGNIQALAAGLNTYIEHALDGFAEIVLVGHSLGGLIIRQYLFNRKLASRPTRVRKVLFYAVPQEGSSLAGISSLISFGHRHLKQLCEKSEFLDTLNDQWAASGIVNDFEFKLVLAVEDMTVSPQSAKSNFRHLEIDQIPGKDHRSIVKPIDQNDLAFIIFKKFLLANLDISKRRPKGALIFDQWLGVEGATGPFFPDKKREKIIDELREVLAVPRNAVRVTGLSGLGKTRIAVEAIRGLSDERKRSVVYLDVAIESNDLNSTVIQWVSEGAAGILVIDNCSVALHDQLLRTTTRPESNLTLLTIDSDLQNSGQCKYVELTRLDDAMIKQMLSHNFGNALPDIDRVVEFAQGFPQMAVLIANARINLDPNIGNLSDDHFAHKLLWGATQERNATDEKILLGCALFDRFGLESETSPEFKYIANNVVEVGESEFYECVQRFADRGIIDKRGRYGQLVPKPLAIRLAAQWWRRNQRQAHVNLLNNMPDSLIASFCEQIGKLDFLPEVKTFTAELCGNQGPFGQAEVILSNRGSRLFRAFVDVNPEATSSALYQVVISLTADEVTAIVGDVRRNLVWALEKLCFHAHLFEESAWTLFLLARGENETWSNNASGIFSQLFRVHLSGTEAAPSVRFTLIERILELGEAKADLIVIGALKQTINTHGGSRTVGAEYQGTKLPLQEWTPLVWQEIFDFWEAAYKILVDMTAKGEAQRAEAMSILGSSIRGFVANGRVKMLDSAIRFIVEHNGPYWPSALDSIKMIFEYDSRNMKADALAMVEEWSKLLDPQNADIHAKLMILVKNPPWEHHEDESGALFDVAAVNAKRLARELSNDLEALSEFIPLLLEGEQKQAYVFGYELAAATDGASSFVDRVFSMIVELDRPNIDLALGLLAGIFTVSISVWNERIDVIAKSSTLHQYYPYFIRTGEIRASHLSCLWDLIRNGYLEPESARALCYGGVTKDIPASVIGDFCLDLAKNSDSGAWVGLDVLFMYSHGNLEKFEQSLESFKALTLLVRLGEGKGHSRNEMHYWKDVVKKLVDREDVEFAISICNRFIESTIDGLDHGDIWHYIKPLLRAIMEKYGPEVWPLFATAIESSAPMQRFWLQQLLERETSLATQQKSVLSALPVSVLIDWCRESPEKGRVFVASCTDIFEGEGEHKRPTELFIALLENFGGDDAVDSALSANMGTRGWSGSLVPYLEADKAGLSHLLDHPSRRVKVWVRRRITYIDQQIAHESMRDDEQGLGVY